MELKLELDDRFKQYLKASVNGPSDGKLELGEKSIVNSGTIGHTLVRFFRSMGAFVGLCQKPPDAKQRQLAAQEAFMKAVDACYNDKPISISGQPVKGVNLFRDNKPVYNMPGRVFFEAANVTHEQSGPLTAGKVLRVVAHMRKLDVLSKAYEAYEGNFPLAVKNAYEKIINSEEGLDLEGKLAFDYIMNKNPPSKPNSVEMKTN